MDKSQAIARLDAIEAEQKELRKIIEGKATFDRDKIYVAIVRKEPYILSGRPNEGFFFYTHENSVMVFDEQKSGQEAINSIEKNGGTVHEFTDTRTALQFFLDNLK